MRIVLDTNVFVSAARVMDDPDDEKFFACAQPAAVALVGSGDRHLLAERLEFK